MNSRSIALWIVRIAAVVSLVLGIVIWPGNADSLISIHILFGAILAIALLVLAVAAIRAKATGLGVLAVIWALALPVLGLTQGAFPESAALAVQVFHLVLGVGAWVIAEVLGRRMA